MRSTVLSGIPEWLRRCTVPILTGLIVSGCADFSRQEIGGHRYPVCVEPDGRKILCQGANRDAIKACSELDLELEEFVSLALEAMQGISQELGL